MTIRVHSSNIRSGGVFVTHVYGDPGDTYYMSTDTLCRPGISNNVVMTFQAVGSAITVSGTLEDSGEVLASPTNATWSSVLSVPAGAMLNSNFQYTTLRIQFAGKGCMHVSMN